MSPTAIVWTGPELEHHARPSLPKEASRRLQRQAARRARRQVALVPLTEDLIPAGSVLSEQTLADIRAGHYALQQIQAPSLAPVYSKAPARKARRQMARSSRRKNRGS